MVGHFETANLAESTQSNKILCELNFCTLTFPFTKGECAYLARKSNVAIDVVSDYFDLKKSIEVEGRSSNRFVFHNFWNILEIKILFGCYGKTSERLRNSELRTQVMDTLCEYYEEFGSNMLIHTALFSESIFQVLSSYSESQVRKPEALELSVMILDQLSDLIVALDNPSVFLEY
jgi:hypothetical protein